MPIRINLLAESQALEDQRRRDPVKRAIWVGAFLVIAAVAVSICLQLQILVRKGELNRVEAQISSRTTEFQQVLANQKNLSEVSQKLGALSQMATNRLLYGTLLNAMQKTTVDDVQLMRFRVEQNYLMNDEVKAKTNSNNRVIPGRPATVSEKTLLTLEARDGSANAGDLVNKYKQVIADSPYFLGQLGKTNDIKLTSLSPPTGLDGKVYVQFTLECRFPEKAR